MTSVLSVSEQSLHEGGRLEVDIDRRELRASGVPVPIGSRAFDVLALLIEKANLLVTKDELIKAVWPGAIVSDNALHVHISAIRKALGRDRDMLKTISGRGYRLTGSWRPRAAGTPAEPGIKQRSGEARPAVQRTLPRPTSELIGRAAAADHVRNLLSAYRAVTLTGTGGIGKTRLALEVANLLFEEFEADCWLVELASLSDSRLLPSSVASALNLDFGTDEISAASIARRLGDRKLLLVIDNCEHLIDAAAHLVEIILARCANVSVLVTSRELLRIDGERAYQVPALRVPAEGTFDSDDVLAHSAIQLFIVRTRKVQAGFQANRDNLPAIAAICRRLDGIPLALEFAAARAATLGVSEVLARLDDRFSILAGGRRTALPRHQTLRATLDWSYELLPESEQRLMRFLGIFAGGFSLDAVVASMGSGGKDTATVEGIANLVVKSVVVVETAETGTRWRLLETIRQYALSKLTASGEKKLAARRHAEFFRELIAPRDALPSTPLTPDQVRLYMLEIDNVRSALDWAFSPEGDAETGVILTAAYVPIWLHASLMAECHRRVERALENLETDVEHGLRRKMQLDLAFGTALLQATAVDERIPTLMAKALEVAESLDDHRSQLTVLWGLWSHRFHSGEHSAMLPVANRFQDVARRQGTERDKMIGERLLGMSLHYRGNQAEAAAHLRKMLAQVSLLYAEGQVSRLFRDHDQRIITRAWLARVLWLEGNIDQARRISLACVSEARAAKNTQTLRFILGWAVCPILIAVGDYPVADRLIAIFADLSARLYFPYWRTVARGLQGALQIARGEFLDGATTLREGLEGRQKLGHRLREPEFLGALAQGLGRLDQTTEGLTMIDEAITSITRNDNYWCLPDALRIKGELLLGDDLDGASAAEACFRESLRISRDQGALFWELRAAVSLAHLRALQNRPSQARAILEPVYRRFTEGFDAPVLVSAKTLLDSLPHP